MYSSCDNKMLGEVKKLMSLGILKHREQIS